MELVVIISLLVALALAAVRWGADSRTGEPSVPGSRGPRTP